jgi:pimeloyl-ACP methyl ester carboxylesterase
LSTACTRDSEPPNYVPVWIPLSRRGGAAAEGVECDAHGHAQGERAQECFCLFARLALHPEPDRPVVMVVHGLFDSSAQDYLQRMAASVFESGPSVLLPDMRDHGDTLRAAPEIATTLGTLEGADLLALAGALRASCTERFTRVGLAAVSGGALDAIRAFTLDREDTLSAGVIALSPLLDVQAAVQDLSASGPCAITRSIELSTGDDLAIAAFSGAAFFGGAALARDLAGERLNGDTAVIAAIGAGVGLLTSLAIDAWLDGGTEPCVTDHAISRMLQDLMHVRWNALRAVGGISPRARQLPIEQVTIETYVRERAQFQAARLGVTLQAFDARGLARDLRTALRSPARRNSRLLVLGATDDPMTRAPALRAFSEETRAMPQVYARVLQRGGHAGMSVVQPVVMHALYERFF